MNWIPDDELPFNYELPKCLIPNIKEARIKSIIDKAAETAKLAHENMIKESLRESGFEFENNTELVAFLQYECICESKPIPGGTQYIIIHKRQHNTIACWSEKTETFPIDNGFVSYNFGTFFNQK